MIDNHAPGADDELLSAFMDGALSPEDAQALRQRLQREPELARRLERLRRADAALREAYEGIVVQPLPEPVLALLRQETEHAQPHHHAPADQQPPGGGPARHPLDSGRETDTVVALPRRESRWSVSPLPMALAASVALLAGLVIGFLAQPRPETSAALALVPAGGAIAPSSALHDVLHTLPSGRSRELSASVAAASRLTFRTMDGAYCRHVDLLSAETALEVLACLREDARWHVELLGFARPPAAPADGVFRPADGPASEPLDGAIDALIEGPPLGPEAEETLIARGWHEPAR